MDMNRKPISIEELTQLAQGEVIEIRNWLENNPPIAVRVKGVDMTPYMMKMNQMPNKLRTAAYEVFNGEVAQKTNAVKDMDLSDMTDMLPLIDALVKDVLVEPTFDEIQAIYPLTLYQKLDIFNHVMGSTDELESFRSRP